MALYVSSSAGPCHRVPRRFKNERGWGLTSGVSIHTCQSERCSGRIPAGKLIAWLDRSPPERIAESHNDDDDRIVIGANGRVIALEDDAGAERGAVRACLDLRCVDAGFARGGRRRMVFVAPGDRLRRCASTILPWLVGLGKLCKLHLESTVPGVGHCALM